MTDIDKIAIVIIGRNEGERLKRCIASVQLSNAKFVYVDSNSSDGSIKYARDQNIDVVDLLATDPLNASVARNAGYKAVVKKYDQVDYIHFIDADCEMAEGWLLKAGQALDDNDDVSVVCGRLREKYPKDNIYTRMCDMSWYIKPGQISSCGGIATMRKKVYEQLEGFDENLIAGADPEFYYRVRKKGDNIICLDEEMGTHDSAMTSYSMWLTRSSKTGYAYANGEKWGRWAKQRRSVLLWAGLVPLSIIVFAFILPVVSLLLSLLYPMQVVRIFNKIEIPYDRKNKLLYALFCVHDKFPELFGFLKYHCVKITGNKHEIIEYKSTKSTGKKTDNHGD